MVCVEASAQTTGNESPIIKELSSSEERVEGLDYLGKRLLFQVKRRMNLTDSEEEAAEDAEKNKKVRIRFLGIEIET
jgi:hypothetical protein